MRKGIVIMAVGVVLGAAITLLSVWLFGSPEGKEQRMPSHVGKHVYVERKMLIKKVECAVIHTKFNCSHIGKDGVVVLDTYNFRKEQAYDALFEDYASMCDLRFCSNCFNDELYQEFLDYEISKK